MKPFSHFNPRTIDDAALVLRRYRGKAHLIAGGTDLLGKMKDRILPDYPEALVNIKTIQGLDAIREEGGRLRIGALAILEDVAHNQLVKEKYAALAEAARKTASPHLREMGSIGGNICQDIRCWYYRHPENRFPCLRKGGGRCYALEGDNRYHSIFGGSVKEGCIAVHPSDTAPALIALNAEVKTSKRTVNVEHFFQVGVKKTTILEDDEIVQEIMIPAPPAFTKSAFLKFALREAIDFPIVNCAVVITSAKGKVKSARICLNAVFVKPYRAVKAEDVITGKEISEGIAEAAGEALISDAKPLQHNAYMVQIAKIMVKRAILSCE
jgi:xanthine dehydrogenase YagS FAD-binding subunit